MQLKQSSAIAVCHQCPLSQSKAGGCVQGKCLCTSPKRQGPGPVDIREAAKYPCPEGRHHGLEPRKLATVEENKNICDGPTPCRFFQGFAESMEGEAVLCFGCSGCVSKQKNAGASPIAKSLLLTRDSCPLYLWTA